MCVQTCVCIYVHVCTHLHVLTSLTLIKFVMCVSNICAHSFQCVHRYPCVPSPSPVLWLGRFILWEDWYDITFEVCVGALFVSIETAVGDSCGSQCIVCGRFVGHPCRLTVVLCL